MSVCKFLRKIILIVSVILANISAQTSAAPFYRETFNFCETDIVTSSSAALYSNWSAFKDGSVIGKVGFLKINTPGSINHLLSYGSNPIGADNGGAFWPKATGALTIFTQEFPFDISKLSYVQYEQRLSGFDSVRKLNDGTQLAFLINNIWYISDQSVRQSDRGIFEPVTFAPHFLTYGTRNNKPGTGPYQPGNFGISLPRSGTVSAFGVFLANVHSKVRIDNFTLGDDSLIQYPTDNPGNISQCPSFQVPDVEGERKGSLFCEISKSKPLGKIKLKSFEKRKMLNAVKGNSLASKRDRGLLSLLFFNGLRIDSISNLTTADYFSVGSLQIISTTGVENQTLAVKANVKKAIDNYLINANLSHSRKISLFQLIDKKSDLAVNSAICQKDILKILKKYAGKAGLRKNLKISK